jgi:hypothetical protein
MWSGTWSRTNSKSWISSMTVSHNNAGAQAATEGSERNCKLPQTVQWPPRYQANRRYRIDAGL